MGAGPSVGTDGAPRGPSLAGVGGSGWAADAGEDCGAGGTTGACSADSAAPGVAGEVLPLCAGLSTGRFGEPSILPMFSSSRRNFS